MSEKTKPQVTAADDDYSMEAVPESARKGFRSMFFVMLGFTFFSASMSVGAKLGNGLDLNGFAAACVIGGVILGVYSMVTAAADGGGLAAVFNQSVGSITLFTGVGYVIGSFISGGTATPNFIRFAKNNKVAVWTTVIAFFLGNTLMFCFGAIGGAFTGKDDIFYVMIAQGLAIPAIIVLGANIWTTNNNALYTGGLAISNITNARMKIATCISGVIGTALAIWLYYNFTGWLNILNCALPPIGITVILDFFLRRDKYKEKNVPLQTANWFNLAGVVAGAVAANLIHAGIAAVNAMVVAAVFYLIGFAATKQK